MFQNIQLELNFAKLTFLCTRFLSDISTEKLVPHDSSKDFRTVFVSNLSYDVDEDQIKLFFCKASLQKRKRRNSNDKLSLVIRKPGFRICENKDADQLRGNREADQRLCFRYTDTTIPLLSKSEISSL